MSVNEVDYIWMDGELYDWKDAKIHVMTHCLHYGTGVFEGIRGYGADSNLFIFRLEDHIKRLFYSAELYFMEVDWSIDELSEAIVNLLRRNNIRENCYIRPLVYRGYGSFGLNSLASPVNVAIIAFPFGKYLDAEKGANCCVTSWRRIANDALPAESKACGNYINSVLAKVEAIKNGFDEAIFLDAHGFVSEGSGENIFIIKDEIIYTPPTYSSILFGITRDTIIQICKEMEIKLIEKPITRTELYYSDEAFFTGTAAEITPIVKIDHHEIGDGKIGEKTSKILKKFTDILYGRDEGHQKWLTAVYKT
jgi:branched-chain amino acid aminotransferase